MARRKVYIEVYSKLLKISLRAMLYCDIPDLVLLSNKARITLYEFLFEHDEIYFDLTNNEIDIGLSLRLDNYFPDVQDDILIDSIKDAFYEIKERLENDINIIYEDVGVTVTGVKDAVEERKIEESCK